MTNPYFMSEVKAPKVGIGIPVFNGEAFPAQAVSSVLNQSSSNLEILIRDHASIARTASICAAIVAGDPRVSDQRMPADIGAAPSFNAIVKASCKSRLKPFREVLDYWQPARRYGSSSLLSAFLW